MIIEIQCLPTPAGTPEDPHAYIEAAIAVIQDSGVHYEVGPLGSTFEGEPDQLWPLLRRVHEAVLAAGADSSVSVVKIAQGSSGTRTMDSLTTSSADPYVGGDRPRQHVGVSLPRQRSG